MKKNKITLEDFKDTSFDSFRIALNDAIIAIDKLVECENIFLNE